MRADRHQHPAERYLFAVVAVGIALLARLPAWSALGTASPYLTFYPAVMLSAHRGGFRPGLLSAILSAVCVWSLLLPSASVNLPEVTALGYFAAVSLFVSYMAGEMRKARSAAEEQRRISEQTLASIGDGVISTDRSGAVSFMNSVAERLTGWPLKEAKGKHIDEVFVVRREETGEPLENPALAALRTGEVVSLSNHSVLICRTGEPIPIDDSGAAIKDVWGGTHGAVLVFRDIGARREAERELRESRERLNRTLESITDAFFALDADWRFTYVNAEAARLLDKDRDKVIGCSIWEEMPYAPAMGMEVVFKRVREQQAPEQFETQSPRTGRWYEMHVYPAEGNGLSVYFRNVTARKKLESDLRDREQRLSRLAESNVIGILFGDVAGNIREANDELLRIIGRTREELTSRCIRWVDITPEEHLAADARAIEEAQMRGACTPYEKEYLRSDGTRVPVLVGFVLLGEKRVESVAFIVDLTARKQAERALQRINEDLQHFTYGASHDLKEPLRMVASYSQLLERRYANQLDDGAREFLGFILEGVGRMKALVDALLEYSRAGEVRRMPREPVRAEAALQESLSSLRTAIEESAATITWDPLPSLMADRLHLTQLFQNLVGNAIHYRSEQAPCIHVSATQHAGRWTISVTDNGIGIAPQHQSRLFAAFQRLHGPERSGTGLGLATCKRIVERYGGEIWVRSDGDGRGSTFEFTLPGEELGSGVTAAPQKESEDELRG